MRRETGGRALAGRTREARPPTGDVDAAGALSGPDAELFLFRPGPARRRAGQGRTEQHAETKSEDAGDDRPALEVPRERPGREGPEGLDADPDRDRSDHRSDTGGPGAETGA